MIDAAAAGHRIISTRLRRGLTCIYYGKEVSRRVIHSYMLMRADEEELSTEAWDMVVRCVICGVGGRWGDLSG